VNPLPVRVILVVEPRQTLGGSTAVISIHVSFTICYVDVGDIGVNAHVCALEEEEHICMCSCTWMCVSIGVFVYVYVCVCVCMCMCVCVCVCVCTWRVCVGGLCVCVCVRHKIFSLANSWPSNAIKYKQTWTDSHTKGSYLPG